jgi:hypothetical protein
MGMKPPPILFILAACLVCGCDKRQKESRQEARLRTDLMIADGRLAALEKQLTRAHDTEKRYDTLIRTLEEDKRKLAAELTVLRGELDHANSRMQTMRQLGRAEAQLEALTTTTPSVSSSYVPSAPAIIQQPDPEPPAWRYPSVNEARAITRKAAVEKWGENYRMVEHEIEKQLTAYASLHGYEKKRWSNPVIRRALNSAGQKWGTNFNMVLYEIEQQLEAKDRLDGKR